MWDANMNALRSDVLMLAVSSDTWCALGMPANGTRQIKLMNQQTGDSP